ncbi:MAG TPA: hypothetical protein VGG11_22920 [Xanthobacteraceae bacterium]
MAGYGGEPPSRFDLFLGDHEMIGPEAKRIQTTLNKETGKLDHRQLHHAIDVVTPEGEKARQITLDERDRGQIPKIIQRERKRHGLPPLSSERLAIEAANYTVRTVENPLIQIDIQVSFAFLRHAMLKIAYELAFLWLGESYLDDPLAVELREAIMKDDVASTDALPGYADWAEPCTAFKTWTPHKAHHLAFASVVAGNVVIAVRIFDIYAAAIPVSHDALRYLKDGAEAIKRPFLAIDAANRKSIQTTFEAELFRLAQAMREHGPPFPDPFCALK